MKSQEILDLQTPFFVENNHLKKVWAHALCPPALVGLSKSMFYKINQTLTSTFGFFFNQESLWEPTILFQSYQELLMNK